MKPKKTDWETEIIYKGRPLSDYRNAILEEAARELEKENCLRSARIIRALKGEK